eukprot:gnl/MRDRNA2_/MRDRNA2_110418_c0_seq1.p1 gnl/MRDRNA2_/MRDRNA2_110418_c0~~gnl/MRDRNA2_/MRDRNA2_110418_c0_seq1.p1  ORF type:complete len:354 (-),score=89.12 gnl/MRDRNA2_/MRDRNA2_110418_c0_seq1:134-1195(-)
MGASYCHHAWSDPSSELEDKGPKLCAEFTQESVVLEHGAAFALEEELVSRPLVCGIAWAPRDLPLRLAVVLLGSSGEMLAELSSQPAALKRNSVSAVRAPPGGIDATRVRFVGEKLESHITALGFAVRMDAKDGGAVSSGKPSVSTRLLDPAVSDDDSICEARTMQVPDVGGMLLVASLSRTGAGWEFRSEGRFLGSTGRPAAQQRKSSGVSKNAEVSRKRVSITPGGPAAAQKKIVESTGHGSSMGPAPDGLTLTTPSNLPTPTKAAPSRNAGKAAAAKKFAPTHTQQAHLDHDAALMQHEWGDDAALRAHQAALVGGQQGGMDVDSDGQASWGDGASSDGDSPAKVKDGRR